MEDFLGRARFAVDVVDTDLQNPGGSLFAQAVADSASQTADDGVLLNGNNLSGLLCCCNDQLLIQRFDRVDVDDLCLDAILCQHLSSCQGLGYHKVATMVRSLPSRRVTPLPISNL